MAHLIPPHGSRPAIVLTRGEAESALRWLTVVANAENRAVREVLEEYIARLNGE